MNNLKPDFNNSQPALSLNLKANALLYRSIPWAAIAINACLLNHLADTQTRVLTATSQPNATLGAVWAVLPAAIVIGLVAGWFTDIKRRVIAAITATAIASGLALAAPSALIALLATPLAIMALHAKQIILGKDSERTRNVFAGAVLTLICAYASYKRFAILPQVMALPIDPDFDSYLQIAQTRFGWNTAYREPLYIWVLQLMKLFWADLNAVLLRVVSIGTSLAAIAAIFELCRRHLNLLTAVIAAGFYADLLFPAYTACRGLREDLIVSLSMLFILVSWNHLKRPITWKSLALWGLLGGANALLRYSSFSFVLITFAGVAAYRSFIDVKPLAQRARFIFPALLAVTLFAPYLYHCKKLYGQTFFLSNFAARFYANEEFGGKRPDFPTREELKKDAYSGGIITPSEYVFNYHTKAEITERISGGFIKTFFGKNFRESYFFPNPNTQPRLLMLFHIIGVILLLFPRRIFLVLQILLFHAPVFFLAISPTFDPRLLIVAMVFNYITVGTAIGIGIEEGRKLFGTDQNNSAQRSGKSTSKHLVTAKEKRHRRRQSQ